MTQTTLDLDLADSGTDLITKLEAWRDALYSVHKGNTEPTYKTTGLDWIDDSATPWVWKKYDGVDWIQIGTVNAGTNEFFAPVDLSHIVGGAESSELTINSGMVTPTRAVHSVDTELDAATDDLANIVPTSLSGRFLIIRPENASRDVVVKHAAGGDGQVNLADAADFTMADTTTWLMLERRGTSPSSAWYEVARHYGNAKAAARTHLGVGTASFQAYLSADQTGIVDSVWTKIQYNTEVFDPLSDYDNATNYRYTPSEAGKYIIGVIIQATTLADGKLLSAGVYKNGAAVAWVSNNAAFTGNQTMMECVTLQDMNGTTDYVEGYFWHNHGSNIGCVGNPKIQFWAVKVAE